MTQFDHTSYIRSVVEQEHIARKQSMVASVCSILPGPFDRILDIGSGVAHESREFQRRHGSELWLIEGTRANNSRKLPSAGKSKYHLSADDFLYYWDIDVLRQTLDDLGTQRYHLIDCDDVSIASEVKFDLVTSWKSCGYHYPLSTYQDLIRRHSHDRTQIVMDVRLYKGVLRLDPGWSVLREISRHGNKYATCILKLQ